MIKDVYGQGMKNYMCSSFYKEVEDSQNWLNCPNCGLKPLVWIFDNGRKTGCGCGESEYRHLNIKAESIMSVHSRNNGNISEYDENELRNNWNHWCETGENLFAKKQTKLKAETGFEIW